MKIQLLVVILTSSLLTVDAQKEGSIKGSIADKVSGLPLDGATVTVLLAKDSSLVSFSRTGSNGLFSIRNIYNGTYRLLVTHIGYANLSRAFVINSVINDIDFGMLVITSSSTLLQEVTVIQEKPPVVIRDDTLKYNAGSFKTRPNAVVEDLLKKLPGMQVDKDGKIKSNGEEVKKVLVDGKDSFFNSRNLDVYINKIRGYLKEDSNLEILTVKGIGYRFVIT